MATREEQAAIPDVDLINVQELQDHPDLRVRLYAVRQLARLIELLEPARQDPDYVECVGDAELFAHLTWATAQISFGSVERYDAQHPPPIAGGRAGPKARPRNRPKRVPPTEGQTPARGTVTLRRNGGLA